MLKFEQRQRVKHKISGRTGVVYGRAEYVFQEPSYLVYWDVETVQSKENPNDWCSEGYLE